MGWWETVSGAVIGDPVADYVDALASTGLRWTCPGHLPSEVRQRLDALYMEGIGRPPTDQELRVLLAFCA